MSEHLKRSGRFFLILIAAVFAIGFISAWTAGVGFLLFVLGIPLLALLLIVKTVVYFVRGLKLAHGDAPTRERMTVVLAAPLMLLTALLAAWPALAAGSFSGTWTRLMVNRGHYKAIIAKAVRGEHSPSETSPAYEEDGGVIYVVDRGPPVRVAFNPEGMLDNWSGIVFDPTREVMLADGFDDEGKFLAPERITKLFHGDLMGCRRLWGDYFHCSFT